MEEQQYDLVIVGGGMVGATLACALADSDLRIAVVESTPAQTEWDESVFDIRVSALTRATQNVFEQVGAWDRMVAHRVAPYRSMHVWDATGPGSIDFDSAEIGEPDLGHIVENRVILASLLERMAQFDNIDLLCPAHCQAMSSDGRGVELELDGERLLRATLVVGADGANSWVREQVGIDTTGWPYEQTAVVATITTSKHHGDAAWQRFMPDGPLAFLPMPGGVSSIVWSTTPEKAEALVALDEPAFLDALQLAFGDNLGRMVATGPRGAFPLMLKHANRYTAERTVLVGNSAHAIHPLAGQGLNLGVSDIAALAELILEARRERRDIGDFALLRRYERWRKGDNIAVMAAMDGFKRLFSNDNKPLSWLRNTGLQLANASGPLKHMVMRRALGVSGDLPKLSQGLPLN